MKTKNKLNKIGVIGLWHLGSVISSCWASKGLKVIAYDNNKLNIRKLKKCLPPVYEPGLSELINNNIKNQNIIYTDNIKHLNSCDFIFLTYDTPINDNDISDIRIIKKNN